MTRFQNIFHKLKITTLTIVVIFAFYMSCIEPSIIVTENVHIPIWISKKIVFISDIHLWIYKWWDFLEKTVKIINRNKPDYVLIGGDLTLFATKPSRATLLSYFSPLKNLSVPTYAILWNHDLMHPGPDLATDLVSVLESLNVHVLNNDIIKLDWFTLVWLWEYWSNDSNTTLLSEKIDLSKTIALIHNPDILSLYTEKSIPALTLAGHVHGWQVRIPYLYKYAIPSQWNYERWYYEEPIWTKKARLFISQWLWETGLPLRFLCPPTLYVIDLQ
jgi:predicted MPP superfamily phosphohydrolase